MKTKELKKTKIVGKMNLHFTQQQEFDVPDTGGHKVTLRKAEGINENTGSLEFMDGAKTTNISFDDLALGNGPHQGYCTLEKDDNLIISKWEGKIATSITEDKLPVTSFEGTMWWIKATGNFANMEGGGTYKGYFTSESSYIVEWEGEFGLKA